MHVGPSGRDVPKGSFFVHATHVLSAVLYLAPIGLMLAASGCGRSEVVGPSAPGDSDPDVGANRSNPVASEVAESTNSDGGLPGALGFSYLTDPALGRIRNGWPHRDELTSLLLAGEEVYVKMLVNAVVSTIVEVVQPEGLAQQTVEELRSSVRDLAKTRFGIFRRLGEEVVAKERGRSKLSSEEYFNQAVECIRESMRASHQFSGPVLQMVRPARGSLSLEQRGRIRRALGFM